MEFESTKKPFHLMECNDQCKILETRINVQKENENLLDAFIRNEKFAVMDK